jgi:hypothetical protein
VGHLLGIVLPLALGAALTPTIVGVQVVTLSASRLPLKRAWMLAAGCALVLGAAVPASELPISWTAGK